jgi:hypothetical protein
MGNEELGNEEITRLLKIGLETEDKKGAHTENANLFALDTL